MTADRLIFVATPTLPSEHSGTKQLAVGCFTGLYEDNPVCAAEYMPLNILLSSTYAIRRSTNPLNAFEYAPPLCLLKFD